jgi:hypothetical protein
VWSRWWGSVGRRAVASDVRRHLGEKNWRVWD